MRGLILGALVCVLLTAGLVAVSAEARADPITTYTDLTAFQAASGSLTVVNFDTDADGTAIQGGTVVTTQYSAWGATFSPHGGGDLKTLGILLGGVEYSHGGGGFEVAFSNPVTELGLWFGGLHPRATNGPTTLDVFGSTGSLIESIVVQDEIGSSPNGNLFLGLHSSEAIASVQVTISSDDFVWFDDLMFGGNQSSPIPEPTTLALFGLGAGALALRRRRRKLA